ncbi:thiol:disulfide interchange protein DsbC [Ectothiorhodosinus mongolicus]|uniref:Thiol:disulfide interchange protein n=1 Tax=Ectothiorhodosinus mongolicus TaxID=233100 RepID=A0A1R3W4U7_9GAMM|nr:DsbC family protein [Ectothiorhodosinus mongolicus]ULX57519.1 disulfide bond formation protein DsbC [Ectothiorhodosinus mongolicus]SIT72607.1 thiol:disulfide interchange protein DsbC [Ectothiorhodosinus mongolicus]
MRKTLVTGVCLAALLSAGAALADAAMDQVRERVQQLVPDGTPSYIGATGVGDLYEVRYGVQTFYISADGRFAIQGELVELETMENLTAVSRAQGRLELLAELPTEGMVTYPASGEHRHTITVFTDVDCPYCRRLHEEVPELNANGVEVRYLMFPRAGEGSATYTKMVNVWCADDKRAAMDRVKDGETIESRQCEVPAEAHVAAGQLMGVNGTPAMLLESGDLVPGYRPADEINRLLEQLVRR